MTDFSHGMVVLVLVWIIINILKTSSDLWTPTVPDLTWFLVIFEDQFSYHWNLDFKWFVQSHPTVQGSPGSPPSAKLTPKYWCVVGRGGSGMILRCWLSRKQSNLIGNVCQCYLIWQIDSLEKHSCQLSVDITWQISWGIKLWRKIFAEDAQFGVRCVVCVMWVLTSLLVPGPPVWALVCPAV